MIPRHRLLAARIGYVVVVLIATLAHLGFSADLAGASGRLARALAVPLAWRDAIDGLRNVALFAGLGSVWVVTSASGRVRAEIAWATLVGFVLSTAVEGLQCFSATRFASVVDVATNTGGAFAGALMVVLLVASAQGRRGARSYLGVPAFLVAGAYGLAALGEALTPLFHSEVQNNLGAGPFDRLHALLAQTLPLSLAEVPFSDVPLYAAAGFLVAMFAAERGKLSGRVAVMLAIGLSALACAAHVAHGMFGLPIRWEAAVTDAGSLAAGVWAARRWLPRLSESLRGAVRARAAIYSYGGLVMMWGWRPFLPDLRPSVIVSQFRSARFVPLASLAERADVFSAVHVGQQFLLYFPVGVLLAVWPLRTAGRLAHLWPALWLALLVEVGHVVILGRYFDLTNVLIACAGLGMGWLVVRRSGFMPYGEALRAHRSREEAAR
jgi:VanZ family protein